MRPAIDVIVRERFRDLLRQYEEGFISALEFINRMEELIRDTIKNYSSE